MVGLLSTWYAPAFLFILILASLIRIAGIFDDFWLDEIWSLRFAQSAHRAREILLGPAFHHDNNHWLNTLYLYALGDRHAWYTYRLPSLATGIGSIVLLWAIARRWGRVAAIAAITLAGFSFIFVQYSSEARGYAPATFFAVLSFLLLRRFVDSTDRRARIRAILGLAYGLACILGFLSHASFIYAFAGGIVWTPIALFRKGLGPAKWIGDLLVLFLAPTVFLAWLYLTAIRGMTIGGGSHASLPHFLAETTTFSLGLPSGWFSAWIGLAIIIASAIAGASILRRKGSDEWVFFLTAGIIAPTVVLCLRHEQLYPRYVFVALPFLALLAAGALSGLSSRGRFGPLAAAVVLVAFVTGNMLHIFRFIAIGRGHYRDAIEYIAAHTPEKLARVGSDSEMRATMLLGFYAPRISAAGGQFEYVPDDSPVPPDWYLFTQQPDDPPVEQLIAPQWNANYRLEAQFPHYGLSGWDWSLFHRVGAPEVVQ